MTFLKVVVWEDYGRRADLVARSTKCRYFALLLSTPTHLTCSNSGWPNRSDDSRASNIRSFTYPPQIKLIRFLPHQPRTHHLPRHAPIPNHSRRLHITCTQIERKRRVCCGWYTSSKSLRYNRVSYVRNTTRAMISSHPLPPHNARTEPNHFRAFYVIGRQSTISFVRSQAQTDPGGCILMERCSWA